ncbi:hypothetical protein TNCT_13681 [Trichonephila clavata]|uniref:Uncharacterized protein n=1 Tax=Trichonephila clavata TaxID=2740835 RepID=A0A8X6JEL5_TRICU|nr:hypothetical protein TNCT_13681 [Trichonephila clavata]
MLGQYRGVFQVHMFVPTRQEKEEQGKRFRKAAEHASGKRREADERIGVLVEFNFRGGGLTQKRVTGIKIAGDEGPRSESVRRPAKGSRKGFSAEHDAEHPDKKSRDRDRFELHKWLCRDASSAAVRVTHAVWGVRHRRAEEPVARTKHPHSERHARNSEETRTHQ